MKLKLLTTVAQLDALRLAEDNVRRTTPTVKVDREALNNLLMDYGRLCARVGVNNLEELFCPDTPQY